VSAIGLTPMLATSALALGYAVGWAAMKAAADGRLRRQRAGMGRSWTDWLLGREPSQRRPF
jgi:hypothetical protein